MQVQSLGREDPLEEEVATHSSILEQRSLVGYSPWGHRESDTTEATAHTRTHVYRHYSALKRKPVLTHATV